MARKRILVVDDEPSVTGAIALILGEKGFDIKTASSGSEAVRLLASQPFDLVFADLRLPDVSGIELLTRIKEDMPDTEVILITAHGSLDITIDAIKRGAFYYAEKPILPDQLFLLVERALQFAAIKRENQTLRRTLARDGEDFGLIGSNAKMRQIHEVIRTTAPSDASVLIEGESGTGKELIATAFHMQSHRVDRPFIRINCAAIPQELIESELFGYKKGAFTGADRDKRGLIEASSGGTLLLDEITEMPAHLQPKLLRVLQEHKIRRLGDDQESPVDFRLISATNRDTNQMMQDGSMRKDLYFRISTIKIKVSPLRERLDDVVLLAERFLRHYVQKYNRNIRDISTEVLSLLSRYDWPGNVRELESVIEHAVLFCRGNQLVPADLPEQIHVAHPEHFKCLIPPYLTMEEIEREAIEQTLGRTGGNVKRTAQILHYHRPTLYRKLRKFGLRSDVNHGGVETEGVPYKESSS
jgi:DNA-binding NtrC family response regulator